MPMSPQDLEREYRKYGFWALVIVCLALAAFVLGPFVPALLGALVMSVLTYPLHQRFLKRFSVAISALLCIFVAFFAVALPIALVGLMAFLQFRGVVEDFSDGTAPVQAQISRGAGTAPPGSTPDAITNVARQLDASMRASLEQLNVNFSLEEWAKDENNRRQIADRVTGPVTRGATNVVINAVLVVVAFLTMFFMLKDGHKLRQPALELLPLPRDLTARIINRTYTTIHAVFMGVVLVALIQGGVATTLYASVGVEPWLLWGAATTVLCAIPLLGSPIVYVPWALLFLTQGKIWQAITLLTVGFIIISNIDNLLRPKYIGERAGLHYISIFFSLLGGIIAFGPLGLFAGPVLLSVLLELIQYAREQRALGQALHAEDAVDGEEVAPEAPVAAE